MEKSQEIRQRDAKTRIKKSHSQQTDVMMDFQDCTSDNDYASTASESETSSSRQRRSSIDKKKPAPSILHCSASFLDTDTSFTEDTELSHNQLSTKPLPQSAIYSEQTTRPSPNLPARSLSHSNPHLLLERAPSSPLASALASVRRPSVQTASYLPYKVSMASPLVTSSFASTSTAGGSARSPALSRFELESAAARPYFEDRAAHRRRSMYERMTSKQYGSCEGSFGSRDLLQQALQPSRYQLKDNRMKLTRGMSEGQRIGMGESTDLMLHGDRSKHNSCDAIDNSTPKSKLRLIAKNMMEPLKKKKGRKVEKSNKA
ncbi:hypothetical protein SARC_03901 [Sphaeroforma arctica JP610]|uniref:Uncharacterized protein n=1 Tax=Sphaeroforma arctica JP610 TaxID=667725 RepID=A0A0L0G4X6_9EUKA|nr:hypothetical protein SARC_03901 [Sphaeroforma arctica JP610]KNC83876.1 hypothetical protein SARC_03901 [Sphaeroforma arctica JP610]|eukprot:XP_014157778.1 hypothetical protein SARC_03901 [Sphaeroforma arctica JP610]